MPPPFKHNALVSCCLMPVLWTVLLAFLPQYVKAQCTGKPAAGQTLAFTAQACAAIPFTLSTDQNYMESGFAFQWESAPDGVFWTNLVDGATPSYLQIQTTDRYYRLKVTCLNSGEFSYSTPLLVPMRPAPTYYSGAFPYKQGFENSWKNGCGLKDLPADHWESMPSSGVHSWRRADQGASAEWFDQGVYGTDFIVGASEGLQYARFHTILGAPLDSGYLELYLDCSSGAASKMLSFDLNDHDSPDFLKILLSVDGGASFSVIGQTSSLTQTAGWQRFIFPFNAQSSTTVLRIVGMVGNTTGTSDIGLDDLVVADYAACSGVPAPSNTLASVAEACIGVKYQLLLDQPYTEVGYTYAWQYSYDSLNWFYTFPPQNQEDLGFSQSLASWYRCEITCLNSGDSIFSNPLKISMFEPEYYAGGLPFVEKFEQPWLSACGEKDQPSLYWYNFPFKEEARWKYRPDYTNVLPPATPLSAEGENYAILGGSSSVTPNADLSVYLDLSAGNPERKLLFDYWSDQGFGKYFTVALSTDGGNNFTLLGDSMALSPEWTTKTLYFTSNSAKTILRFRGNIQDQALIAIDHIRLVDRTICSGTPVLAQTLASDTAFCVPTTVRFTLDESYTDDQIVFQWQISYDSLNWTDLNDGKQAIYTALIEKKAWYRCRVGCLASGNAVFSAPIFVHYFGPLYYAGPYPYVMDFEDPWINQCGERDVPSENWNNFEDKARNSVRRDDDGALVGWNLPPYVPQGFQGAHYAAFKNNEIDLTQRGGLYLYLDCSQGDSTWNLSFDYYLFDFGIQVYISKDGGKTYEYLIFDLLPNGTPWFKASVDFISSSAKTVIYFEFRKNASFFDIAIDNVQVRRSNNFNTIEGQVYQDTNGNCIKDPGEPPFSEKIIKFSPGERYASTDTTGKYQILIPFGTYTVETILPPHHDLPCGSAIVNGVVVDQAARDTVSFGLHPIPGIRDLEVLLTPSTPVRLGFPAIFTGTVRNIGTDTVHQGSLSLEFPGYALLFTGCDSIGTLNGTNFQVALGNLAPGATISLRFYFVVRSDIALFMQEIGLTATATQLDLDANPDNNQQTTYATITASYDPNDKLLMSPRPDSVSNSILPGVYGFDYTIRFQNTGTDTAFTVVLEDTLDFDFEPLSFRTVASSHPVQGTISPQGNIRWRFDQILLPSFTTDELASHGFVRFQITTKSLQNGDTVCNRAGIYFDVNPPVITNLVETLVKKPDAAVEPESPAIVWRIFPNPVYGDQLTIAWDAPAPEYGDLYAVDVLGRIWNFGQIELVEGENARQLDIATLPPGMYQFYIARAGGPVLPVRVMARF